MGDPTVRAAGAASPPRLAGALAGQLAAAGGLLLLLESLRVWAPSVLFVYGDAGSTPAAQLGTFALVPFVIAAVAGPVAVRRAGPRPAALVAAGVLVTARLGLQATSGGDPQLVAATVAVAAGFGWLMAVAGGAVARRDAAVGLVAGLGFDAALHAAGGGIDLAWRSGPVTWVGLVLVAVLFLAATWISADGRQEPASALAWMAVGPALAVIAVAGSAARLGAVTDLGGLTVTLVVGGALVAGLLAVVGAWRVRTRLTAVAGGALAVLGLYLSVSAPMPFESAGWKVVGHVALLVGLPLVIGSVGWTAGRGGSAAAGGAAAGLLLFFVVVFGYYAGYDIRLPFDNHLVLWGGAVAAWLLATAATPSPALLQGAGAGRGGAVLGGVVVAAVAVAGVAGVTESGPPAAATGDGAPVRVMLYNLHMGFDVHGRLDVDGLAEVIRAQAPDIVALNEVDRGWFTTGAVDVLPHLARKVGLPYVFAPAADDVWGNAILSRYPVSRVRVTELPRGDTAMRRSALSLLAEVAPRRHLGVMVTHLHQTEGEGQARLAQARRVAAEAADFVDADVPVVLLGDLNAAPDAAELEPLRRLLVNASDTLGSPPTYPSDAPVERIDHIFVSPGLRASALQVPHRLASDHLAVALTVAPAEAG